MADPETFGLVTVDREQLLRTRPGRQIHVHLDGEDVTRRCMSADDEEGYVVLACLDQAAHDVRVRDGLKHQDQVTGRLCVRKVPGKVEIAYGEPFQDAAPDLQAPR